MLPTMSSLPTRLALAIIRRYPQAWRDRYEIELAGFVEDSSTGWRDVVDLARGCVVERARGFSERHPDGAWMLLGVALYVLAVGFYGVLVQLAAFLHAQFSEPPAILVWAAMIALFPLIPFGLWASVRATRAKPWGVFSPVPPRRAVIVWLALFSMSIVAMHWSDPPGSPPSRFPLFDSLHWIVWVPWIKGALDFYWPEAPRLSFELMKLAGLRAQLRRSKKTLRRHESQRPDLGYSALVEQDRHMVAEHERELAAAIAELRQRPGWEAPGTVPTGRESL